MINNIDIDKLKKIFVPKGEKFNQIVQSIINWANISGKPTVFPPETHTQDFDTITNSSWQRPILSITNEGTATAGNRYIVGSSPTGIFSGFTSNDIVEYDGANWQSETPVQGWVAYNSNTDSLYTFDGSTWQELSAGGGSGSIDINSLTEKTTPVSNDILLIEDFEDSYNKKKIKISSLSLSGGSMKMKFYHKNGYPFASTSTRTESGFGNRVRPYVDVIISALVGKCDWANGVTYRASIYASDGTTELAYKDFVGDGTTGTYKNFILDSPYTLLANTYYYIYLYRTDAGNIKKYYGSVQTIPIMVTDTYFTGSPSSQNSAAGPYAIMLEISADFNSAVSIMMFNNWSVIPSSF